MRNREAVYHRRWRSITFSLCLIFGVLGLLEFTGYYSYNARSFFYESFSSKTKDPEKSASSLPIILDWTTFFGTPISEIAEKGMDECSDTCIFTNNKSLTDRASAVLFHIRDIDINNLPLIRHDWQRYVFFLMESPVHTGNAFKRLPKGFFNFSMTYRLDSDIILPYCSILPYCLTRKHDISHVNNNSVGNVEYNVEEVKNTALSKTKMVAQFVSNCHTPSKREDYVKELAKFVSVDIYGSCSGKICPRSNQCDQMLTENYRFYLSLENSVCRHYVTEKFWRMLNLVVPIVLRDSDYREIAPQNSYIAADQFDSAKELANYLNLLAVNSTEYLKYFEWTKHYWKKADLKDTSSYCRLCQMIRDKTVPKKVYSDMEHWWTTLGACQHQFASRLLRNVNS